MYQLPEDEEINETLSEHSAHKDPLKNQQTRPVFKPALTSDNNLLKSPDSKSDQSKFSAVVFSKPIELEKKDSEEKSEDYEDDYENDFDDAFEKSNTEESQGKLSKSKTEEIKNNKKEIPKAIHQSLDRHPQSSTQDTINHKTGGLSEDTKLLKRDEKQSPTYSYSPDQAHGHQRGESKQSRQTT